MTLALIEGYMVVRKLRCLHQLPQKVSKGHGWNLACFWDLLHWWIVFLFYLVWLIFKRKKPTYMISSKNLPLAYIWTFTNQFLLNLVWLQRLLNLIGWYQIERPWPSCKVRVLWKSENFSDRYFPTFFCQFGYHFGMLLWAVGLCELMLNLCA